MNRHQKKVLALAGAIGNLSLTCAVAGVATFAWFTSTAVANANNISITTSNEFVRLDYTILKWSDDSRQGVSSNLNDPTEFILPDYDEYISERNKYRNLIVRANLVFPRTVDTSNTEIVIDITKLESSTLKEADAEYDDNAIIRKLTSNVTQYKSVVTSYTLEGSDTPIPVGVPIQEIQGSYKTANDAKYKTAVQYFKTRKTPTTFISLMNGQPVDPHNGRTIRLVPELYNVGVIKQATVYLECSYNQNLIDALIKDRYKENISNIAGDIEKINFGIDSFEGSTFGADATGQFIRMDDAGDSYSGQYLDAYISSSSQQILDGSLTTGLEDFDDEPPTGVNIDGNQRSAEYYICSNSNKIYPASEIENSSFTFDKENGTFESSNGHFIGNYTTYDGIISRTDSTDLDNSLDYDPNEEFSAIVKPTHQETMQLQYDTNSEKFAYYSQPKNEINLYRYHENDPIEATLTTLTVTPPTGANATYSLGQYFSLNGVNCVASYTRSTPSGNETFTINVTNICKYTVDNDIELIPEKSTFSFSGTKTITVSYKDKNTTLTGSFELTIIEDTLDALTITTEPSKKLYRLGENFDISDMVITGTFAIAGPIVLNSTEYTCKIGTGVKSYNNGTPLDVVGTNLIVYVEYTGAAMVPSNFVWPSFQITVKETVIEITNAPTYLDPETSGTITFSFNGNVSWSISGTPDSLSFDSVEVETSTITSYNGSGYTTVSDTITIYALADGRVTITATIAGTSFMDSVEITIGDPPLEVIFVSGVDRGTASGSGQSDTLTKSGFQFSCPSCYTAVNDENQYRFYSGSNLTISTASVDSAYRIVRIEFTNTPEKGVKYSASNFTANVGTYDDTTFVWTGYSQTVVFNCGTQVRVGTIRIVYENIPTYIVSFDPGNGGGTMADVEVQGTTYTLPYCTFTAPSQDQTFKCWEVGGIQYDEGETITLSGDVTVYAVWSEIYIISFNANGGGGTMQSIQKAEGSSYNLPVCTFTPPSGQVFSHWTVGGVIKNVGDSITVNSDTVVTANWKNLYDVTLNPGLGTGDAFVDEQVGDGETYTLPSCPETFNAPTNKVFSHWLVNNVVKHPGDTITITSNTTITAQWGDYYTITIDPNIANGGSGTSTVVHVLQNGSYTLPTIASCNFTAQSGYTFSHWQIGDDVTARAPGYVIQNVTANTVIKAIWIADATESTINLGSASGNWNLNATWKDLPNKTSPLTDTLEDELGNTWTVTYVFAQYSITANSNYIQFGSGSKPATSVTFTTTLPTTKTLVSFSTKMGGFSGTTGTISLKIGDTEVGSGSLNASNDVTISANSQNLSNNPGTVLTITVTSIAKGMKVYYISYSY